VRAPEFQACAGPPCRPDQFDLGRLGQSASRSAFDVFVTPRRRPATPAEKKLQLTIRCSAPSTTSLTSIENPPVSTSIRPSSNAQSVDTRSALTAPKAPTARRSPGAGTFGQHGRAHEPHHVGDRLLSASSDVPSTAGNSAVARLPSSSTDWRDKMATCAVTRTSS